MYASEAFFKWLAKSRIVVVSCIQNNDAEFTYWIDGPMEVHLLEYIGHMQVLNQQMETIILNINKSINFDMRIKSMSVI